MTPRHNRRRQFTEAIDNPLVRTARSWRHLTTDPNSAAATLHRSMTLRRAWEPAVPDRIEHLTSLCAGRRVLDIGCVAHDASRMSSPTWLHRHIAEVADQCIGVDIDPDGIAAMKRAGFTAICHDLDHGLGPVEPYGPFDVILAGELLEHVESLGMVFRLAATALAPQGQLVITTPNPFAPKRVRAGRRGIVWENVDHVCYLFPSGVAELAERHGLELSSARTVDDHGHRNRGRRLRRLRRLIRGTRWVDVGWRTRGAIGTSRVESRRALPFVERLWPGRHRFRGETFVYVVVRHSFHSAPHGD